MMRIKALLLLLSLLGAVPLLSQTCSDVGTASGKKIASLPAASSYGGCVSLVDDATSKNVLGSGGGSALLAVVSNGTSWVLLDGTLSAGTGLSVSCNTVTCTLTVDATGAEITFSPTGNLSSTDVQAALAELDTEKQASLGFTAEDSANKGAVSGYAPLDGSQDVPDANIQDAIMRDAEWTAASLTAQGKIEIATGTETNTGTDATRAVSPDGLDDWTGSAQITTVGTIGAGTWEGTAIADGYIPDTITIDAATASEQTRIPVYNQSGAQIDDGKTVYISGYKTGDELPSVSLAKADSASTMPAIGIMDGDLASNASGYVVAFGKLTGQVTSSYSVGDALYISKDTAGEMTSTKPSGATELIQKVAQVTRSNITVGVLEVFGAGRSNDVPNDIDAAKIGGNNVSDTEFDYLNGVTSAIQTQIDGKEGTLTNSAGLAGALNDETGTGVAVFGTSPTIITPTIASMTNAAHDHTDAAGGGTITEASISDLTHTDTSKLPLAGGTMTGQLITDNLGVEFQESDTNPTCAAGNYNIFADASESTLKKCIDGVATNLDTTGGSPAFSDISGATNTTAAMVVGTGASLGVSGSGTIAATSYTVTAADVGTASPTLDDTDASVEWEDATDMESDGALSADVVAAAEMADADHGDVAWSSGVATVEAVDEAAVTAHEAALTILSTQLPAANRTRSFGFAFGDAGGSALTAGATQYGIVTLPYACTIVSWDAAVDAGTASFKVWRAATGTAIPTSGGSINTSGVGVSTGTAIHSTTLTDFTDTTLSANDILAFNLFASATAKYASFQINCTVD